MKTESVLEDRLADRPIDQPDHRGVGAEGDVTAPIPLDPRSIPVAPEVPHLIGGNDGIGGAGEKVAPFAGDLRLQDERGDHAEHPSYGSDFEPAGFGLAQMQGWTMAFDRPRHIGERDARDDAVELVIETSEERCVIAAQGIAHDADAGGGLLFPHPAEHAPDVPESLGNRVDEVEDVEGEEPIATEASDLAKTVERKRRHDQVQAQPSMQPCRRKRRQIDEGPSHLEAVNANQPGTRLGSVAQDPGVSGSDRPVGEPALTSGLVGMRGIATFEAEMFIAKPPQLRLAKIR